MLETPRASQELGVESFRSAIGMPFVSDVQETHTVSMAASMSTAVQSGAAPPRAPRTSAEGHGARGSSCGCRESVGSRVLMPHVTGVVSIYRTLVTRTTNGAQRAR